MIKVPRRVVNSELHSAFGADSISPEPLGSLILIPGPQPEHAMSSRLLYMDVPYTRNGEREKKEGEKRSSSVCGWLEGSMEPRQREKESGSGLRSSLYIRVCVTYLSLSLSLSPSISV